MSEEKRINKYDLHELRERAEKAVDTIELMNETFKTSPREYAIYVCMACIEDAYNKGLNNAGSSE